MDETKFNQDMQSFNGETNEHYKPIGISKTDESVNSNAMEGIVFVKNKPNFEKEFIEPSLNKAFGTRHKVYKHIDQLFRG